MRRFWGHRAATGGRFRVEEPATTVTAFGLWFLSGPTAAENLWRPTCWAVTLVGIARPWVSAHWGHAHAGGGA